MRANRLLGASLVEHQHVSIDALDSANERFLELLANPASNQRASLLSILLNEKQALDEATLLEKLVEEEGLGLVDVRCIDLPDEIKLTMNIDECWATWTVPFDLVEDTRYIATAYYLSPVVRTHWESKIKGNIIWYAASQESISGFLEALEAEAAAKAAGAN